MDKAKEMKIESECKHYLHGHYPLRPLEYFKEMQEEASPEEMADKYGQGESLQQFEKELAELFDKDDCCVYKRFRIIKFR